MHRFNEEFFHLLSKTRTHKPGSNNVVFIVALPLIQNEETVR